MIFTAVGKTVGVEGSQILDLDVLSLRCLLNQSIQYTIGNRSWNSGRMLRKSHLRDHQYTQGIQAHGTDEITRKNIDRKFKRLLSEILQG